MRILLLSFYYEPDLSAGSFRTTALVHELSREVGESGKIEVLTALPNRYQTFTVEAQRLEQQGNVTIRRFALPGHKSGILDQSRSFAVFMWQVLKYTRGQRYDLVFATSGRLMTAFTGALVARLCKAPLYLDIRDIFTETIGNLYARRPQLAALPLLKVIERWTVRSATKINLVSPGFRAHFERLRPGLEFSSFTNGIDEEFIEYDFATPKTPRSRPVIVYAGNIGDGQGLHRIIPGASKLLGERMHFRVVGDGGRRQQLEEALSTVDGGSVELLSPVPRSKLMEYYRDADILFLHLNDHPGFFKVLPSKLFEYAATGKPILAGVSGVAREFIEREIENAVCFDPCDADACLMALGGLRLEMTPRTEFIERFRRTALTKAMAREIVRTALDRV